jgi:hypothetical protein
MYLRDILKCVLEAVITETGTFGQDMDESLVKTCLGLYEADPRALSAYPGLTIRRKVENIPLRHFTSVKPWSPSISRGVWSRIEESIEAALKERPASRSGMVVRDWGLQPDWEQTQSIGHLARYVQSILDQTLELDRTDFQAEFPGQICDVPWRDNVADSFEVEAEPDMTGISMEELPGEEDTPDYMEELPGEEDTPDYR